MSLATEFYAANVDSEKEAWIWIGLSALQIEIPEGWFAIDIPEGIYGVGWYADPETAATGFAANVLMQSFPLVDADMAVSAIDDLLTSDVENAYVTTLSDVTTIFQSDSCLAKSISLKIDGEEESVVQYLEAVVVRHEEPYLIVLTATTPQRDGKFSHPVLREFIEGVNKEIIFLAS